MSRPPLDYEEQLRAFSSSGNNNPASTSSSSSSSSWFGTSKPSIKLPTGEDSGGGGGASQSLLGGVFSSISQRTQETLGNITAQVPRSSQELDCLRLTSFQRYTSAIVIVCLSLFLFSMSFFFLFTLAPGKFISTWSVASILILLGAAVFKGIYPFVRQEFSLARLPYSGAYFTSLALSLYFSSSFFLSLFFIVIQMFALAWFMGSYLPGGTSALSWMTSSVARSYLPI